MASRVELQKMLEQILGTKNVYFQPPESVKMKYPAIVYYRRSIENKFANNDVYSQFYSYQLVVIDPDPDSTIVFKVSKLPRCTYDRHYVSDNLNHDVFRILY